MKVGDGDGGKSNSMSPLFFVPRFLTHGVV